ncbi:MAG: hypothetical protein ACTSQJ_08070 [Promethearchaeota archaeon]
MNKEKILSIRIKPTDHEILQQRAKDLEINTSKYIRSILKSDLNAARNGYQIVNIKLKQNEFKTIEQLAKNLNIKPTKYLRKIVKTSVKDKKSDREIISPESDGRSYLKLKKEVEKFKELYQEKSIECNILEREKKELLSEKAQLEVRIKEQENTIEVLTNLKNTFLDELLFLMKFFQSNAKLLKEHDKKFIMENKEKFAMIAKQLEEIN